MKLKMPKMRYVFQAMVLRLGGTANARAVLNAQLDAWRKKIYTMTMRTNITDGWGNLRTHCGK